MKALRKFLDKIEPHVQPNRRFSFLRSTYDAFDTFLFVPGHTTKSGAHIRDAIDLKRTMSVVLIALLPALLFGMYNTGYQHFLSLGQLEAQSFFSIFWYGFLKVLPLIVVSYVVGLGIEFAFAQKRAHSVNEGYLVSGMLIPMIMPVDVPLWMLAVSVAFAVIIGKEVFGGTGMNILNPALTARAFLFFAYPSHMTGDKVWIAEKADAFSGATPMAHAAAFEMDKIPSATDMFFGLIPGSIGETSTLAILIGAFILVATGIGSLRIMISVFAGGFFTGWLINTFAVNPYMAFPAWEHLVMGGFAFGAVFMATDPVTGTQTAFGKIIYGFLIGVFAIIIRVLNPAYPEGMMLAILLMNVFAPLIDHYIVQANIRRRLKRAKSNL